MYNVGLYISKFDYGGVSKFISNLDEALKRNNINTNIITFKNITNRDLHILNNTSELIDYLKKNNIKIIISNGWLDHIKLYILCKLYKCNITFIQVLHSDLSQLDMNNNSIIGKLKKRLIKYSFNHSDVCVAVSKAVQKEVNQSGYFKKKFIQIYNPIVDERLKYSIKPNFIDIENKKEINLVMIGWIRRLKGQDIVIKALSNIEDKRVKLNIIGGVFEEEYYKELNDFIKKNSLGDRVKFLGVKDNVISILKNMDILILASRSEALPTVIIEALSCEVPVIASDCKHGPREILENEKYGLLFDINDYIGLEKQIEKLIKDNEKYNYFKNLSEKRAMVFTYEKAMQEYKKLLFKINIGERNE